MRERRRGYIFHLGFLFLFFPFPVLFAGIPTKTHIVQPKETAFSISQKYRLDWKILLEWNGKKESEGLKVGEKLKLPPDPSLVHSSENVSKESPKIAVGKFHSPLKKLPPVAIPYSGVSYYPNKGVLFKTSRHKEVHSSSGGKVVVLDQMDGYRKYIILEHKGGFSSVYANLGSVSVKQGETVKPGEHLGELEDGKGLYFQINQGTKTIDPMQFLKQ